MILFLCTGNINRSAAAALACRRAGVPACSAGTSRIAAKGRPMGGRMRVALSDVGIPLAATAWHRSRYAGDVELLGVDRVIGFQPSHAAWATVAWPGLPCTLALDVLARDGWTKVPDPQFDGTLFPDVARYVLDLAEALRCASLS